MSYMVQNLIDVCCRPILETLRIMSDFPVTFITFISFLIGLTNQDIVTGLLAFAIGILVIFAAYVLTLGKAFGRGGLKKRKKDYELGAY